MPCFRICSHRGERRVKRFDKVHISISLVVYSSSWHTAKFSEPTEKNHFWVANFLLGRRSPWIPMVCAYKLELYLIQHILSRCISHRRRGCCSLRPNCADHSNTYTSYPGPPLDSVNAISPSTSLGSPHLLSLAIRGPCSVYHVRGPTWGTDYCNFGRSPTSTSRSARSREGIRSHLRL